MRQKDTRNPEDERVDCRIHGGANKPLCGLGECGLSRTEQSIFTLLVEAVTLPWQFTVLFVLTILHINPPQYQIAKMNMAAIFIRQYFEHVLIEKMNND